MYDFFKKKTFKWTCRLLYSEQPVLRQSLNFPGRGLVCSAVCIIVSCFYWVVYEIQQCLELSLYSDIQTTVCCLWSHVDHRCAHSNKGVSHINSDDHSYPNIAQSEHPRLSRAEPVVCLCGWVGAEVVLRKPGTHGSRTTLILLIHLYVLLHLWAHSFWGVLIWNICFCFSDLVSCLQRGSHSDSQRLR